MIFQTEKQIKEYGDKIPQDKIANIEAGLNDLKEAHKAQNFGAIDSAMERLNTAWQAASEDMYKATQDGAGQNPNADANGNSNSDYTDVEFEEVNNK